MKVLITSAGLDIPARLAPTLNTNHQVRLTDRTVRFTPHSPRTITSEEKEEIETGLEFVSSDLGHDETTNELVHGMDAVIHWGQVDPRLSLPEQLDYQTRCTYNLIYAASNEGVTRFVHLSTLSVMGKYDEDLEVTEKFRPLPTTEPDVLGAHLGEYVCREFTREGRIDVVCLRLGEIIDNGEGIVGTSALHFDDLVRAVELALNWDVTRERIPTFERPTAATGWGLFHIQSPVPGARYSTNSAQQYLDYNPTFRE